jgi:hypothetical protein
LWLSIVSQMLSTSLLYCSPKPFPMIGPNRERREVWGCRTLWLPRRSSPPPPPGYPTTPSHLHRAGAVEAKHSERACPEFVVGTLESSGGASPPSTSPVRFSYQPHTLTLATRPGALSCSECALTTPATIGGPRERSPPQSIIGSASGGAQLASFWCKRASAG